YIKETDYYHIKESENLDVIDDANLSSISTDLKNQFVLYIKNQDRVLKGWCRKLAERAGLATAGSEGSVAGVGALIVNKMFGVIAGISGGVSNYYLVEKDGYNTALMVRRGKLARKDNNQKISWGKAALICIGFVLSVLSGFCYGALSAYAVHQKILSPGAAKIGHSIFLSALIVVIALFPVAGLLITFSSMVFVAIAEIIKTDWAKEWQNFKENWHLFWEAWDDMSTWQATKEIICVIGSVLNKIIAGVITGMIAWFFYAFFGTKVATVYSSIFGGSKAVAMMIGKICTIANVTTNIPFLLRNNSSLVRNLAIVVVAAVSFTCLIATTIVRAAVFGFVVAPAMAIVYGLKALGNWASGKPTTFKKDMKNLYQGFCRYLKKSAMVSLTAIGKVAKWISQVCTDTTISGTIGKHREAIALKAQSPASKAEDKPEAEEKIGLNTLQTTRQQQNISAMEQDPIAENQMLAGQTKGTFVLNCAFWNGAGQGLLFAPDGTNLLHSQAHISNGTATPIVTATQGANSGATNAQAIAKMNKAVEVTAALSKTVLPKVSANRASFFQEKATAWVESIQESHNEAYSKP
ncbi:MAG: hypothetical protein K0U12_05550, partial [Gammaproteobacteria bacterium]|nr:hypothetical protein [Gammaproteobacteria bacterium]